jgi:hypothetical protein
MEIYIVNQTGNISTAFIKANRYILQIYQEQLEKTTIFQKSNILETLWKKEFNAELLKKKNNDHWDTIRFNSEIEKTLFLLKWS